jgi:hypothetical protein
VDLELQARDIELQARLEEQRARRMQRAKPRGFQVLCIELSEISQIIFVVYVQVRALTQRNISSFH